MTDWSELRASLRRNARGSATWTNLTEPHQHNLRNPTGRKRTDGARAAVFQQRRCEICLGAKTPDGHHKRQRPNEETIPLIEFHYRSAQWSWTEYLAQEDADRHRQTRVSQGPELKFDPEPSTLLFSRVLASRCNTTVLTESATGSKSSFWRGERTNLAAQGRLRAQPAQLMKSYES